LRGDVSHAGSDRNATTKLPLLDIQMFILTLMCVQGSKISPRIAGRREAASCGTLEVLETAREMRMPCGKKRYQGFQADTLNGQPQRVNGRLLLAIVFQSGPRSSVIYICAYTGVTYRLLSWVWLALGAQHDAAVAVLI
jgi:hypothetical protein